MAEVKRVRHMPIGLRFLFAVIAYIVGVVIALLFTGGAVFASGWAFGLACAVFAFGGYVRKAGADETIWVEKWGIASWQVVPIGVLLGLWTWIALQFRPKDPYGELPPVAMGTVLMLGVVWVLFVGMVLLVWFYQVKPRMNMSLRDKTPEEQAVAAVDPVLLRRAGLAVKSQHSNEYRYPTWWKAFLDEKGRPAFHVQMIGGQQTFANYQKSAESIASAWRVPRVLVELVNPADHIVRITAVLREFKREGVVEWQMHPALAQGQVPPVAEYMRHMVIGEIDDTGEPWAVSQGVGNFTALSAGLMGSGKTAGINAREAHWVLHPHIDVIHIDLKDGKALRPWSPGLSAFAPGTNSGLQLLKWSVAQMLGERGREMREAGVSNCWDGYPDGRPFLGPDHHVRVVIVDEIQRFFGADSKFGKEMAAKAESLLSDFARLCRAYGYIVHVATQKPTADAIPTQVRDNIAERDAYRMNTKSVQYILDGWTEAKEENFNLPSPSTIEEKQIGRAVVTVDGKFTYVQSAYLRDRQIEQIAAQAAPYTDRFLNWEEEAEHLDLDALVAEIDADSMADLKRTSGWTDLEAEKRQQAPTQAQPVYDVPTQPATPAQQPTQPAPRQPAVPPEDSRSANGAETGSQGELKRESKSADDWTV